MSILKKSPMVLILALALCAMRGTAVSTDSQTLPNATIPPLYEVTENGFVSGAAQLPEDVTAAYRGSYGIPADAERGYAFRVTLSSPVTARELSESLADALWIAGIAEYAQGRERVSEDIVSLEEAGFSSVSEAERGGYHRFYVNLEDFWGLDAGWQPTTDRTRFLDYAMPSGLPEMYVTAGYIYQTYLADGGEFDYLQAQFVGVAAEMLIPTEPEDVGILITGEQELVVIAAEPTTSGMVAYRLSAAL